MRRQRFGTFTGGIDLLAEKSATRASAIRPVDWPRRLWVPLDPCGLGSAEPVAARGRRVAAGETIGVGAGEMPIFAPAAGVVGRVDRCVVAGGAAGPRYGPGMEITDLDEEPPPRPTETGYDWRAASRDSLAARVAESGLTTYARPLKPLSRFCRVAAEAKVDTLIANGMENEPYLTAEHRILTEHGPEVMVGMAILRRLVGAKVATLAVDTRLTDSYRPIAASAGGYGIETLAVEHKYPIGQPVMLTRVLTGRKVPPGRPTRAVGVAVVNVAACFALYRAVAFGEMPTGRVVTVSGIGIDRPGNYLVPFGMAAEAVLAAGGVSDEAEGLCCGGPMTGEALPDDLVTGPATSAYLSLPAGDGKPATVCIRCGWCTDSCPVRLDVANLNDMFELRQIDRARRYEVPACLDCGVCSYVCPARLPLAHRMGQLKQAVARAQRLADPQRTGSP